MDQEQRGPAIKRYRRPGLAEEDVAQIKAHLQQGKSSAILAMYFNVDRRTISGIRDRQIYRQVAPAAKARPFRYNASMSPSPRDRDGSGGVRHSATFPRERARSTLAKSHHKVGANLTIPGRRDESA